MLKKGGASFTDTLKNMINGKSLLCRRNNTLTGYAYVPTYYNGMCNYWTLIQFGVATALCFVPVYLSSNDHLVYGVIFLYSHMFSSRVPIILEHTLYYLDYMCNYSDFQFSLASIPPSSISTPFRSIHF